MNAEIAGYLAYARDHYIQEAAAIQMFPRDGKTPNLIERKMIAERAAHAANCARLAKEIRNG